MADWITTDEAIEIGKNQFQQEYHVEYLRQLLRNDRVKGRKFARSWQVNHASWVEYLKSNKDSDDKRRGGRPINPEA